MEYVGIESIKEAYAQRLLDDGDIQRGIEVYNKGITEPVFEGLAFHPETEPVLSVVNNAVSEISVDILGLNKEMTGIADCYSSLVNDIKTRLESVDQQIDAEEDRVRDINIICGNYSEFETIRTLNDTNTGGSYSFKNKTFSCQRLTTSTTALSVTGVQGNGLEGNSYIKGVLTDSGKRDYLVDNDTITNWEYGRYTSSTAHTGLPFRVNTDQEEARCTIELKGAAEFGAIELDSARNIVVEDVLTSSDGFSYVSSMDKERHINSKDHRYDNPDYAYESKIIAFPSSKYIKLQVRSDDIDTKETVVVEGTEYPDIHRHVVSIDNIAADSSTYGEAVIRTGELITSPVNSIAIFGNEYVPPHFVDGVYFEYTLTINGVDHKIVPINSNQAGIKVVRFSDYSVGDNYILHIQESIKSASLKIMIKSSDSLSTPYLSNLKVCYGKAVVS